MIIYILGPYHQCLFHTFYVRNSTSRAILMQYVFPQSSNLAWRNICRQYHNNTVLESYYLLQYNHTTKLCIIILCRCKCPPYCESTLTAHARTQISFNDYETSFDIEFYVDALCWGCRSKIQTLISQLEWKRISFSMGNRMGRMSSRKTLASTSRAAAEHLPVGGSHLLL